MTLALSRRSPTVLAVMLLSSVFVAAAVAPSTAATKPSIAGVSLRANAEFTAGMAIVYGATGVVVCISRKCKAALKSQSGIWNIIPRGAYPVLRAGQSREVIVFAVNATGGYSFAVRQVTVR